MNNEVLIEQVAHLLTCWKARRKRMRKGKLQGNPGYHNLNICIKELEAVLTDKPLPKEATL